MRNLVQRFNDFATSQARFFPWVTLNLTSCCLKARAGPKQMVCLDLGTAANTANQAVLGSETEREGATRDGHPQRRDPLGAGRPVGRSQQVDAEGGPHRSPRRTPAAQRELLEIPPAALVLSAVGPPEEGKDRRFPPATAPYPTGNRTAGSPRMT